MTIPELKLGQKEKTTSPYAKLSYRENFFPEDNQFLLRFDISDNISQFDSSQTHIIGCVDKIQKAFNVYHNVQNVKHL